MGVTGIDGIEAIQNYWDTGNEPTTDNGYVTLRFKGLNGGDHEILPLQDRELVETVSDIYRANVVCQANELAMDGGGELSPDDVRKIAAKEGWGPRVCAVVDGYKILKIRNSDGAELVAEAIMTCKPNWTLFGIGIGRHDHHLYLARECDESEIRELKHKKGKKAKTRKPKDEGHHGHKNRHGGGGGTNDKGQPREGDEGNFEAPPPEGEQHGNGGRHAGRQHGGKAKGGGDRGGNGFSGPRASHAEPPSVADAYRTVNAGHWQRSQGPWPFAGIAVAGNARSREDGARGGHGARTRPPRVGHGGIR